MTTYRHGGDVDHDGAMASLRFHAMVDAVRPSALPVEWNN